MPYRSTFDCLWCGLPHACGGSDDIEGWASICPACIGRAGENAFLRFRLRRALTERAAAASAGDHRQTGRDQDAPPLDPRVAADPRATEPQDLAAEMLAYYEARAPEYDDWYLRRGRYSHGPEDDAAWAAELAEARAWLEGLPLAGRIVEIAAGTGWWSTTLAGKGPLRMLDGSAAPLAIAARRLAEAGLDARRDVRDAWAEPDETVDALFAGFWLSHVPKARLPGFLSLVRRWLRPGGTFVFIDSREDAASGARDHPKVADGVSVRRLEDGRAFRVVKEFHSPRMLETTLLGAGFRDVTIRATDRFFLLGAATATGPVASRSTP